MEKGWPHGSPQNTGKPYFRVWNLHCGQGATSRNNFGGSLETNRGKEATSHLVYFLSSL